MLGIQSVGLWTGDAFRLYPLGYHHFAKFCRKMRDICIYSNVLRFSPRWFICCIHHSGLVWKIIRTVCFSHEYSIVLFSLKLFESGLGSKKSITGRMKHWSEVIRKSPVVSWLRTHLCGKWPDSHIQKALEFSMLRVSCTLGRLEQLFVARTLAARTECSLSLFLASSLLLFHILLSRMHMNCILILYRLFIS